MQTRWRTGSAGLALVAACGGAEPADPDAATLARPRIYATFASHNEDDRNDRCAPGLFGLPGPAAGPAAGQTVPPRDRYLAIRATTVAFAQMLVEVGAAYAMQTDYPFLDAVVRYDDATVTATTGGQNLIAYLARLAPSQVTVDAHSHEHAYLGEPVNYADAAAFVAELSGLPSTGVVGGFLSSPAADEDWTRFQAGPLAAVRARSAGYQWSPRVLWGGASPSHADDAEISGVWRPIDGDRFDQHAASAPIPTIGVWYATETTAAGIDDLLARLRAGTLEAGHQYTVTIMTTQCDLDQARIDEVRAIVTAHAADVAAGDLVWATFPDVLQAWTDVYGEAPTVLHRGG